MTTTPTQMDAANSTHSLDKKDAELLRIGDVAKMFDVSLRTLRFYEDKGLIAPLRDGTTRLYGHRDVARLKLIARGTKIGFSLRDIKQMMDLYDPTGTNLRQYRVALEKSERQLARLEEQRRQTEDAIAELERAREEARETLERRQQANAA